MNKKSILIPAMIATLLTAAPSFAAQAGTANNSLSTEQQTTADKAIGDAVQKQNDLKQTINKNVLDGFREVEKALTLLDQKDKSKEAIAALEAATGKFDIALAANPELGLVPIDTTVSMFELITTEDVVEKTIDAAEDLLRDNRVQEARELLLPLRDELVSTTTYIPMATYPATIKLAARALVDGDNTKAKDILAQGLDSFVVSKSIIPLSLLRAEAFLGQAAELDRSKQKTKIVELLDAAEAQVNLSIALGYTDKDSAPYDALVSQIKSLRWAIKGPNAVERLYSELKKSFKDLIHKEAKPQPDSNH
jgi:hypothetical protein